MTATRWNIFGIDYVATWINSKDYYDRHYEASMVIDSGHVKVFVLDDSIPVGDLSETPGIASPQSAIAAQTAVGNVLRSRARIEFIRLLREYPYGMEPDANGMNGGGDPRAPAARADKARRRPLQPGEFLEEQSERTKPDRIVPDHIVFDAPLADGPAADAQRESVVKMFEGLPDQLKGNAFVLASQVTADTPQAVKDAVSEYDAAAKSAQAAELADMVNKIEPGNVHSEVGAANTADNPRTEPVHVDPESGPANESGPVSDPDGPAPDDSGPAGTTASDPDGT